MHDQISDIENRLTKLKRPKKMRTDSGNDEGGGAGGGSGGSDDGNDGIPPTPARQSHYRPRPPCPTSHPDTDSSEALMERYDKLKVSKYYPPRPPGPTPRDLVDIGLARVPKSELESLRSKGLVKGRKREDGQFIVVLPDTPPPTSIRDNYFPPLPVDLQIIALHYPMYRLNH